MQKRDLLSPAVITADGDGGVASAGTGRADQCSEEMPSLRPPSKVEGQRLVYSNRCGRVMLKNVTVQNQGVDYSHEGNVYWQHKVCV